MIIALVRSTLLIGQIAWQFRGRISIQYYHRLSLLHIPYTSTGVLCDDIPFIIYRISQLYRVNCVVNISDNSNRTHLKQQNKCSVRTYGIRYCEVETVRERGKGGREIPYNTSITHTHE